MREADISGEGLRTWKRDRVKDHEGPVYPSTKLDIMLRM
jgi:hypothetical protein